MDSLYDYPEYYDILFGWDRDREAASYEAILRSRVVHRPGRVLELGAGTGQIAVRLARRGWDVTALDWSAAMLAYAADAAAAAGTSVRMLQADMRAFTTPAQFDAALCPLGTFAMLPDDASALAHLRATAGALAPGAPYVLDLTLTTSQPGEPEHPSDSWSMKRGDVEVRAGPGGIVVTRPDREAPLALSWGPPLRAFDAVRMRSLIDEAALFVLAGHYPEVGRVGEDEVSVFGEECRPGLPSGRGLIVLEQRGEPVRNPPR